MCLRLGALSPQAQLGVLLKDKLVVLLELLNLRAISGGGGGG